MRSSSLKAVDNYAQVQAQTQVTIKKIYVSLKTVQDNTILTVNFIKALS